MLTIKNTKTGTVWVLPAAVVVGMLLLSACGAQPTPQTITDPTAASPAQTSTQPPAADSPTATIPAATDVLPTAAPTEGASDAPISFKNDVLPILESRCIKCHGGDRTEAKLDLTTYAGLMAGAEKGVSVVAGDAAKSKLIQLTQSGKMPKRSAKLLPDQLQILVDWVNQGALDN